MTTLLHGRWQPSFCYSPYFFHLKIWDLYLSLCCSWITWQTWRFYFFTELWYQIAPYDKRHNLVDGKRKKIFDMIITGSISVMFGYRISDIAILEKKKGWLNWNNRYWSLCNHWEQKRFTEKSQSQTKEEKNCIKIIGAANRI